MLLSLKQLSVSFSSENRLLPAVESVNFNVESGEFVSLVGESGSGKSVSALSIMGLLPPNAVRLSGECLFQGKDLFALTGEKLNQVRGTEISMIFQEPMTALNPVMTIGNQITEVLRFHQSTERRFTKKELRQQGIGLLKEVGIPEPERRYDEYPHQFSGGMRQRVMIAIALAGQPRLLIADEPTTALDVTVQAQIMELLDRLRKERGMAILLITHNLALVCQRADRVYVMYAGRIMESASGQELFKNPAHPYTRLLLRAIPAAGQRGTALSAIGGQVPPPDRRSAGCVFASRCPFAMDECCQGAAPVLEELSPEHRLACHRNALPLPPVPAVAQKSEKANDFCLKVEGLKVHFPVNRPLFGKAKKFVHAVDGVDFELRRGETLALVGESGCGKTTIGKALIRLVEPTDGSILWDDGSDWRTCPSGKMNLYRRRIQMIFQDPYSSLNPRLTVGESICEGMDSFGIATGEKRQEALKKILSLVSLPEECLNRYPHQFSGGQRQRIGLARALATEPEILICDECTSALDVSVQAQILNLLKELQERLHLSILFITHDLGVVSYLADKVAVMYLGQFVETGTAAEIFESPVHPYTKALLAAAPSFEKKESFVPLQGEIPSPVNPPEGCRFHPRCSNAGPQCKNGAVPAWRKISDTHAVRCDVTNS